jgi:hypothetical protein
VCELQVLLDKGAMRVMAGAVISRAASPIVGQGLKKRFQYYYRQAQSKITREAAGFPYLQASNQHGLHSTVCTKVLRH